MKKALIVEDNVSVQKMDESMLHHLGYTCKIVSCGEDAISQFSAVFNTDSSFSVIILDMNLTGKVSSGKEVARQINNLDPDVHIIAVSGNQNLENINELQQVGISHILYKPFRLDDLRKIL